MDKKWYSSKQAADYLGYKEGTLRLGRSQGQLSGKAHPEFKKIGRAVRYDKAVLDQWIRDSCDN